jgi:hypothetical protein
MVVSCYQKPTHQVDRPTTGLSPLACRGLAAWLVITTFSVGLDTGELATEVVDSAEVPESQVMPEADTSSRPFDNKVVVLTGSSLLAAWLGMTTFPVGLNAGELATEVVGIQVVTEAIPEADTSNRLFNNGVVVLTGSSLGLGAWLGITTLSVGFKTGELETEVVSSTEVVLPAEADTWSKPSNNLNGVVVLTSSSLGLLATWWVTTTLSMGLKQQSWKRKW